MAGQKPMRTEFGIHQRLESCGKVSEWLVPEVQEVVDFIPEVNFRDNHLPWGDWHSLFSNRYGHQCNFIIYFFLIDGVLNGKENRTSRRKFVDLPPAWRLQAFQPMWRASLKKSSDEVKFSHCLDLVCATVDDIDVFVTLWAENESKSLPVFSVNWRLVHLHPARGLGHHQGVL